jgi:pentatricopeptide repeat protein
LLRVCAKADDVERGIKILDMMRQHSPSQVNVSSYCVLVDALAKMGRVSRVRTAAHQRLRDRVCVDVFCLRAVP